MTFMKGTPYLHAAQTARAAALITNPFRARVKRLARKRGGVGGQGRTAPGPERRGRAQACRERHRDTPGRCAQEAALDRRLTRRGSGGPFHSSSNSKTCPLRVASYRSVDFFGSP